MPTTSSDRRSLTGTISSKFISFFPLQAVIVFVCLGCSPDSRDIRKIILISANAEWTVVKEIYPDAKTEPSPFGEFFSKRVEGENVLFFHGGWGKVSAAASAQYCIDRWHPDYMINLGTCGGFKNQVDRYATLLVTRTVIYDIMEAMGDSREAIEDYTTSIDLGWLTSPIPTDVKKVVMVSADRDLVAGQLSMLSKEYGAIAGDWETGAIAWTCSKNKTRVLILRGVSDLVDTNGQGEAYGNEAVFVAGTKVVMQKLLKDLPAWLQLCK